MQLPEKYAIVISCKLFSILACHNFYANVDLQMPD